jgi:hypothetical protein
VLEVERYTYEANRERRLGTSEGKLVLIHGSDIVGVYESKMDAIAGGYRCFGNVPFFAKEVVRVEVRDRFLTNFFVM